MGKVTLDGAQWPAPPSFWAWFRNGRESIVLAGEEWRSANSPLQPAGSFALQVLTSLTDRAAAGDVRRLHRWCNTQRVARDDETTARAAATIVRAQLTEWFRRGEARWNAAYDPLTLEGSRGPTIDLSSDGALSLLDGITGRIPPDDASQFYSVQSVGSLLLLSAVQGVFSHTLLACRDCRKLVVRDRTDRRKRCPPCSAKRQDWKRAPAFDREVRRVLDRIRKRRKLNLSKDPKGLGRCLAIQDAVRKGELSAREGIARLRDEISRDERGRKPTGNRPV